MGASLLSFDYARSSKRRIRSFTFGAGYRNKIQVSNIVARATESRVSFVVSIQECGLSIYIVWTNIGAYLHKHSKGPLSMSDNLGVVSNRGDAVQDACGGFAGLLV